MTKIDPRRGLTLDEIRRRRELNLLKIEVTTLRLQQSLSLPVSLIKAVGVGHKIAQIMRRYFKKCRKNDET